MNTLTVLVIVIIIAGVIFSVGNTDRRKANELKFDIIYLNIQTMLESMPVNKTSQLKLLSYFDDLRKCRYKNFEKVQVLDREFKKKYKDVGKALLQEQDTQDEFDLKNIDFENMANRFEVRREAEKLDK